MHLSAIDWAIIALYIVFAVWIGIRFARKAGQDVDQFFLSGRTLPWWIAGTSMVATTFAADTPLVITGWVRDHGIWKNWLWWCYAGGGFMTVFIFARYWRRGQVMTTAELAELRYGGKDAGRLRGFLGFYHAGITNTITLCWVILAAVKIMDVLLEVDKATAVAVACAIALSYSLLAGFWGVVLTDLVQFTIAMIGSIMLAVFAWSAINGSTGLMEAAASKPDFTADTLAFFPASGDGGFFDRSFWAVNFATVMVYLGVAWWAAEAVDGGGLVVQRISAAKDERSGVLGALWYNVAHYALRPWPWILVALASLVLLPHIRVEAPVDAIVSSVDGSSITLLPATIDDSGGTPTAMPIAGATPEIIDIEDSRHSDDWAPYVMVSASADPAVPTIVRTGDLIAKSDSERAYVVMMKRYLPVGILGLAVAALLAAFMSTIDTHVNLASSYFVNDVYRRFIVKDASPKHYVAAARVSCVVVLTLAGLMAYQSNSISNLFTFFLAFLSGVGPIYIMRWLWWRVRASTEITAMLASSITTVVLHTGEFHVSFGQLSDTDGKLPYEIILCIVASVSAGSAILSMLVTRSPEPQSLVPFYRQVRPMGLWGPVKALCPDVVARNEAGAAVTGVVGGLMATYGLMLGLGFYFVGSSTTQTSIAFLIAAVGAILVVRSLKRVLAVLD
jgi:solute:Na+ symporter, SSS family